MSSNTQRLIDRDIRTRQEVRRGTVLTVPVRRNFRQAQIDRTVYVVDVDIGASRPLIDVIVKSSSGLGGRAYAGVGRAVEVQRNQGGRWFVIGAGDRIRNAGQVQLFDESTEVFETAIPDGFTFKVKPYDFYAINLVYGSAGYGNAILIDIDGNQVIP